MLAQALVNHSTIQLVDVSYNLLLDEGVRAFAECLKGNTELKELYTSAVDATAASAIVLAEALCTNQSLRVLSMLSDELDSRCCKAFGSMLEAKKTLLRLDLGLLNPTSNQLKPFVSALAGNRALKRLCFGDTEILRQDCISLINVARQGGVLNKLCIAHHDRLNDTKCSICTRFVRGLGDACYSDLKACPLRHVKRKF